MPVDEVSRTVEEGLHVATAEKATLYDCVDGLVYVGVVKFERTRDKQAGDGEQVIVDGEVHEVVISVHGHGVGV